MVGTLEGRGTFDFKTLQLKPNAPRLKSSPNAFMTALYKMIEDGSCDDTICWGEDQKSFHIWRPTHFETLLPQYFGVKASFSSWRQRIGELGFERLPTDERGPAQGRTTLVANWWAFTHPFFCRELVNKLKSSEEFLLPVWPFDAWRENIREDYAWMATINPGKPLQLSVNEQEAQRKGDKPPYTETRFPVY
mmetsp:Transcript_15581/g.21534  ORF Transcript_15581/g.21534 Transcript_15581/m.21534 type:complete len:192 (+) Transcript_15581:90-665(+)